jgi:hypothetical protein
MAKLNLLFQLYQGLRHLSRDRKLKRNTAFYNDLLVGKATGVREYCYGYD